MDDPLFNIVLLNPEIPNNTGNIGRTCAATGCRLHVIHPIGFDMSEKARRRAGMDYWNIVDCREHDSWSAFLETEQPARLWLFTVKSRRPFWQSPFRQGDFMVFGKESGGVPEPVHEWVMNRYGEDARVTLPMVADPRARSLNVATAVCAAIYEGMRQIESGSR